MVAVSAWISGVETGSVECSGKNRCKLCFGHWCVGIKGCFGSAVSVQSHES